MKILCSKLKLDVTRIRVKKLRNIFTIKASKADTTEPDLEEEAKKAARQAQKAAETKEFKDFTLNLF